MKRLYIVDQSMNFGLVRDVLSSAIGGALTWGGVELFNIIKGTPLNNEQRKTLLKIIGAFSTLSVGFGVVKDWRYRSTLKKLGYSPDKPVVELKEGKDKYIIMIPQSSDLSEGTGGAFTVQSHKSFKKRYGKEISKDSRLYKDPEFYNSVAVLPTTAEKLLASLPIPALTKFICRINGISYNKIKSSDGVIYIDFAQLKKFSPKELDFILYHEIGHQKDFKEGQVRHKNDNENDFISWDGEMIADLISAKHNRMSAKEYIDCMSKLLASSGGVLSRPLSDPHIKNRILKVKEYLEKGRDPYGILKGRDTIKELKFRFA